VTSTVFVDTSALYAVLDRDDANHSTAASAWAKIFDGIEAGMTDATTHSGVLIETTALVQRRLGMEAVRALHHRLVPVLDVYWLDQRLHEQAVTALLAADRRDLSLVDWASFEVMRREGIDVALAFDDDFVARGFALFE
jgi:predicted nucleic acid-binding protein